MDMGSFTGRAGECQRKSMKTNKYRNCSNDGYFFS